MVKVESGLLWLIQLRKNLWSNWHLESWNGIFVKSLLDRKIIQCNLSLSTKVLVPWRKQTVLILTNPRIRNGWSWGCCPPSLTSTRVIMNWSKSLSLPAGIECNISSLTFLWLLWILWPMASQVYPTFEIIFSTEYVLPYDFFPPQMQNGQKVFN
jgi:hypothetical protein